MGEYKHDSLCIDFIPFERHIKPDLGVATFLLTFQNIEDLTF